jgi:hypothetical protein
VFDRASAVALSGLACVLTLGVSARVAAAAGHATPGAVHTLYEGAAASEQSCPNAALRVGLSADLPDCRAYERVSAPGSEPRFEYRGAPIDLTEVGAIGNGQARGVQASDSGGGLAYVAEYPPEGSASDGEYLVSSRGANGWSTVEMIPPQSASYSLACKNAYIVAYSPELTSSILADGVGQPGSSFDEGTLRCGTDDPRLIAGEPEGFQNLFLSEGEDLSYRLIDITPFGVSPDDAWFQAASEDEGLSRVVFEEQAPLVPGAPAGKDLYEYSNGIVRLATVLPGGEAVLGSLANADVYEHDEAGQGPEAFTHAVSGDGSRVFFTAGGNLYLRENAEREQSALAGGDECTEPGKACTVEVDAPGVGAPGPGGAGRFMWASDDGSRVFFTDESRLTSNSTAAPGAPDLYEYDLAAPPGGRLTDLTVNALDAGEPAGVLGVSGASEDGAYVYFVAEGVLSSAPNSQGELAHAGEPNLYEVHEDGAPTFIATLGGQDQLDWEQRELTARVSPDGRFVAFNSLRPLTRYDNDDASTGEADQEIFLYDAAAAQLSCVSCDPSGARPTAPASIRQSEDDKIAGPGPPQAPGRLQRFLTDDGRVFFDTANPLLPQAADGQSNVYEYARGTLHLISSGSAAGGSYFYEASASGSDVFFLTPQHLPSGAASSEYAVYDAREDGGFAEAPPAAAQCEEAETCRSPPGDAPPVPAGSIAFTGLGNPPASGLPRATVRLLGGIRRGARLRLRVSVPAAGHITLAGHAIVTLKRALARSGSYTLEVSLTQRARALLRRHHRLRLRLRLVYAPAGASATASSVSLTVVD